METAHRRRARAALTAIASCTAAVAAASCTGSGESVESGGSADPQPTAQVFPSARGWETRSPVAAGFDPAALQAAIDYTLTHETSMPEDPGQYLRDRFEGQEHQEIVGPTQNRGGVNGLILKDGYLIAEWGDTKRVDMTFSVTKSYLSTVAGLALGRGLIRDLDDLVSDYVADGTFASEQNEQISWRMLLQQTSEWEGSLWGKPDQADRRMGVDRQLQRPGTFWEYNDVRVNLLAYSLLHVWKKPLPEVLKAEIMDPIGASDEWRWHGYETSWTEIDGRRVQSVSGGGHWGGGLFIGTADHARFGLLFQNRGRWGDRQLLSESWVRDATTPSSVQPNYGFMWWLNTNRTQFPSAPETSFFALGAGSTSVIWVDPDNGIVTATRWVDGTEHVDEFIRLVLRALQ